MNALGIVFDCLPVVGISELLKVVQHGVALIYRQEGEVARPAECVDANPFRQMV